MHGNLLGAGRVENKCVPFFALVLIVLGAPAFSAAETTVADLDRLVDAGAPSLALGVIEREGPAFTASPVRWQRWERRRLAILETLQDWPAIIEQVDGYPTPLPDDFQVRASESAARAHTALGDGHAAAAILAGLVWGSTRDTALARERAERLTRWRGLLIDAYLVSGRLADAETAALRFGLDHGRPPAGWRVAHAKALIRANRNAEARERLLGLETTQVTYMKLLLRARNASADPIELLSAMAPYLGEGRLLEAERAQLWASLADAAGGYRDHEVRVTAMEQAVALDAPVAAEDRFVPVDADGLWDAYRDYAAALANEAHLLVGRFDAWLALADTLSVGGDVKARALYAYLSTQDRDAAVAESARGGLVSSLAGQSRGLRVLGALYLESRRHSALSAIPADLRGPLIAYCVEAGEPDVAAQLLAGLDGGARDALAPPWRGAVAVTLVGEGRVDEAVAMIEQSLPAGAAADPVTLDAAADVALALQTAGAYEQSAALFARLLAAAPAVGVERRELLLLAAEAEGLAGHHERSARLYIASAALPAGTPADAWSRRARLGAAGALARAGLAADAVSVLRATLEDDPGTDERVFVERRLRRF
jgi:tetratricopeptide (TPR) repeat protein